MSSQSARRSSISACRNGLRHKPSTWRFGAQAAIWPQLGRLSPAIVEQIEIDSRYSGYLARQEADVRAFRRDEALSLPADLDYASVAGLSTEIRGKLTLARPATLGAASRISGVTPAALVALLAHVRRREDRLAG